MSDCRVPMPAYERPEGTLELRIDFKGEEQPWTYPLALNGREVGRVTVGGVEYAPVRELVTEFRGAILESAVEGGAR